MKYLRLTCIFIFFACLAAVGQVNQIWYKKGKVLYAVPVAGIDSVTYGQFLSADTFFIVIDRASRRIVYDTVDVHVPGMVYHDTIHTTHTVHLKPGRRIGVFSVAKDKQVSFSQGNLQYVQNQNVWKFADQQYEMIGARNVKDGQLANKIDLFGWSGKDSKIPYGVGSSTKYAEYKGDFVDWGSNVINYESPNKWRTLSIDEWEYIYYERENAQKLIALGTVNDVQGLIILPDNWHLPDGITFVSSVDVGMQWQDGREEGSYFNSSNKDHTKDNIYTEEQWQKMEEAGAVFLPCAGWRSGVNWRKASLAELKTNYVGSYWTSSSLLNNSSYYFFRFTQQEIRKYPFLSNLSLMARGRSVRLVHDTIVPKLSKRIGVFSVAKDKQVSFSQGNLQYVQNQNVWKFADQQYEYIGARNVKDGQLANKIDLFGWSADNTTAPFGVSTSTDVADYAGEFVDWGVNEINGEAPNTWRTLSKDEWEYLFEKRKNAQKLYGVAQVNGSNGIIILPDNWSFDNGISFKTGLHSVETDDYSIFQSFTDQEFSVLESFGAVFIHASGWREGISIEKSQRSGYYWSSTPYNNTDAYRMTFYSYYLKPCDIHYKYRGRSVRLVHDTIVPKSSKRIGVFSVAKDRQVSFSQGNLQYVQNQNVWKFADQQYEYIGARNVKDGQLANKIDLFGWSADNTTAPFGVSTSTDVADYAGEFVDWGVNEINGEAPNTWRTLSKDEWEYLINERPNAQQLRTKGSVNGNGGVILLPDDWGCPTGCSITIVADEMNLLPDVNAYSLEEWRKMEDAGAILLPAAGMRRNKDLTIVQHENIFGGYWSCTIKDASNSYCYNFHVQPCEYVNYSNWIYGRSVRLVHDTIVPPPAPCRTFEVNGVKFNMMCVEGGTFMMGAGSDAHQVTLSDYYIGETEVTQSLWLAVMGGELPPRQEIIGDEYPVADITMEDCRRFVEQLSELTGRHFRIPTEAEWEYAARGGKKSKGYKYAGSDNIDEVAWYNGNAIEYRPQIVKQYKPNELGVYDMSGNVCEWVSDWYAPYNLYPQINPTGASIYSDSKLPHIHRGGCWTYASAQCQPERRTGWSHKSANGVGLRLVMSDEEPFREVYVNDTTRFYLRKVEKGTFMMGAKEDDPIVMQNLDAKGDELPQHEVTLDSDYYVAENEITQSLWEAVMGTDVYDMYAALTRPSVYPNPVGMAYPMYYVYTKDILEFARKLSQMTGLKFRLPTEAEWEFAAKGGNRSHGYLYAGSNNVDSVAWYGNKGMQQVGQLMPNELGIYDMSGNGLERCVDYLEYHQPYESGDVVNPRGKIRQNGNRAYRGGAHNMHKDSVRVTHRAPQTPTFTSINVGARLVMNEEHHFQTFNVGSVWFDMIYVKGGTFMMGCTQEMDSDAYAHESPMHEVTLSDYYIGQIEVTQALWKNVMGNSNNPSTHKGNDLPVHNVSWDDCQLFIEKLNLMTGLNFRMPTEAEWEYAARGGVKSRGYKYAGSDNIEEVAWYKENADGKPHTFATKQPNELGIYDMSGNVFEWCYDWYGLYSVEAQIDPQGPESGPYRVFRGGGWKHVSSSRVAYRRTTGANLDQTSIGIRLVLDERPVPPPAPEYVDLGLSVKWATFNLGASAPEDYGDYFAWGETEPKENYNWTTYLYCDGTESVMTKYNDVDGKIILDKEDDAAHVNWGGNWRMPTDEELTELREKCTWEWTVQNGVNGYKVVGVNGNSIFLPAAGYARATNYHAISTSGFYWSSSFYIDDICNAYYVNFSSKGVY